MIRIVVRRIALWAYLLSAAGSAWPAAAEDAKPLSESWLTALTGSLLVFDYAQEANVDSSVGWSTTEWDTKGVPTLQIGLELMSPSLRSLPAAPRVVGFAGARFGPNQTVTTAGVGVGEYPDEGTVTALVDSAVALAEQNPFPPPGTSTSYQKSPEPDTFKGQGSEVMSTYLNGGWYLGLGMVFEIRKQEPMLRLRPFVSYMGERAKVRAELVSVTGVHKDHVLYPSDVFWWLYPPYNDFRQYDYTIHHVSGLRHGVFHYLGPGIEAEVVLASGEKTTVSFFGQAHFLWNVGNRSIDIYNPNSIASCKYTADHFSLRGGAGVRVAWQSGF